MKRMESRAIATLIKMMETLSEADQNRVVEMLRVYIADLQDEVAWDESFRKTQAKLTGVDRLVRQQIKENRAEPFDFDKL